MNHTQVVAYRSRQHLVPCPRPVRFGRSPVTWNRVISSSYHSYHPITATRNAKPTGTLMEVLQASRQPLAHPPVPGPEQRQVQSPQDQPGLMLLIKLSQVRQALEKMRRYEVACMEPRVCHTAVQILLHACGKQKGQTISSNVFAQLAEAKDSRLQQVADSMGMELAQLAKEADAVLSRNKDVHPESLEELEDDVNDLKGCITQSVERAFPQECRIIEVYMVFKGAFPERFTEVAEVPQKAQRKRHAGKDKLRALDSGPDCDSSGGRGKHKRGAKRRPHVANDSEGSDGGRPSRHGGRPSRSTQPRSSYQQPGGHGAAGGGGGGNRGDAPQDRTCYVCKAPDHLAAQCPHLEGYSPEARADAVRAARREPRSHPAPSYGVRRRLPLCTRDHRRAPGGSGRRGGTSGPFSRCRRQPLEAAAAFAAAGVMAAAAALVAASPLAAQDACRHLVSLGCCGGAS